MTESSRLQGALADRYRVDREIGAGGISVVGTRAASSGSVSQTILVQNWPAALLEAPDE